MISYRFIIDDETDLYFEVDKDISTSIEKPDKEYPDWTLLENHKCDQCSLEKGSRKTCPAALSILPVTESFASIISHEKLKVEVEDGDVFFTAVVPAQSGIRSLIGLLMALSDCPVMRLFRPMAQFHRPFDSSDNTIVRVTGMYLIAQHFRHHDGKETDWELKGILDLYANLHKVNQKLADRIRLACEQDATVNSLIILDSFGYAVEMSVEEHLEQLRHLFDDYLAD